MCRIIWSIEITSPTIYFHNIRSLQKHCEDLVSDSLIVHSEVLILQETMTTSNDIFTIPGHSLVCRVDGKARTPGSGTHVYLRNPAICHTKFAHTSSHDSGNIETMVIEYFDPCITLETVTLVSIYRSPRVSLRNLISNLDQMLSKIHLSSHCVITDNFNVDSISRERYLISFASKDFSSAISGVSTNYNSQLDNAFYRGVYPTVHFYESYFNDHKAILIDLSCVNKNLFVSSSNANSDNNSVCIHQTRQDVIIDRVNIPPPVPTMLPGILHVHS